MPVRCRGIAKTGDSFLLRFGIDGYAKYGEGEDLFHSLTEVRDRVKIMKLG
jgi:hypothetical protein